MAKPTLHFQALIDLHADEIAGFLRGIVGPDDADDCLQETFLAALRAYERFDGENPRAWLFAIARSKALDEHRSRRRRPAPSEMPEPAVNGHGPEDERLGEIWCEVAALPEKQRAAVILRFGSDLRYREVGDVMGVSEAAARRNVHEGVAKLRAARGVMC